MQLYLARQTQDRFGQWLAQVTILETPGKLGAWLQGQLLQQGYARTYSTLGNETLATEMLEIEEQARQAARGMWAVPAFVVRSPFDLDQAVDSFQIVQGVVTGVGVTSSRVYLNFGKDWREDFTVMISRPDVARFPGRLRGLRALAGKQVRGWVFGLNGPAIRADHACVLEVFRN